MTNGLLTGFLRLKITTEHLTGALFGTVHDNINHLDQETLSDHDLRDLGMLDGRVSPSTVDRSARSDVWDLIDRTPHSL